ncbi:hypothetical protein CFC21_112218 [Triticum aestivum]|uniref:Secreted protein n=2 Tax=Triticum aestivum TaxID=4565 RepID=A0A9R0G4B9_WHEAT|nr:hypothetical protein [Triticum aestivum]
MQQLLHVCFCIMMFSFWVSWALFRLMFLCWCRFFRNSLVVVALLYVDRLLWLTGLCSSCHCSTRRRMKILPVGMGLEREEEIHVGLYAHCAQGLLVSISVYASPFILSFN